MKTDIVKDQKFLATVVVVMMAMAAAVVGVAMFSNNSDAVGPSEWNGADVAAGDTAVLSGAYTMTDDATISGTLTVTGTLTIGEGVTLAIGTGDDGKLFMGESAVLNIDGTLAVRNNATTTVLYGAAVNYDNGAIDGILLMLNASYTYTGAELTPSFHVTSSSTIGDPKFTPVTGSIDADTYEGSKVSGIINNNTLTVYSDFVIEPKVLHFAANKAITATARAYDGTAAVTLVVPSDVAFNQDDIVSGDTVTLHSPTTEITGTAASKNVGTQNVIWGAGVLTGADAGNYVLQTITVEITAKALTVTGLTAAGRAYNGTTTVTIETAAGTALAGVVTGDTVTLDVTAAVGTMADKTVGTDKAVTVTGCALSGADAGNYTVTNPTDVKVTITVKDLTITGLTAKDRVYNGAADKTVTVEGTAALSGLVAIEGQTEAVTLGGTPVYVLTDNGEVGTGKAVTTTGYDISGDDSANYNLTQPALTVDIAKKELTVTGLTATDRVYDGTTTVTIVVSGTELAGVVTGDTVTILSAVGKTADKNAGDSKAVTVTDFVLDGAAKDNYTVKSPTDVTVNISAYQQMIGTSQVTTVSDLKAPYTGKTHFENVAFTTTYGETIYFNVDTGAKAMGNYNYRADAEALSSTEFDAALIADAVSANYEIDYTSSVFTITTVEVSDNVRTNYNVQLVQTDAGTVTAEDSLLHFEITLSSDQDTAMKNMQGMFFYITIRAGNEESQALYDIRGIDVVNIDEFGNLSIPFDFDYKNLPGLYSIEVQIMNNSSDLIQLPNAGSEAECMITVNEAAIE